MLTYYLQYVNFEQRSGVKCKHKNSCNYNFFHADLLRLTYKKNLQLRLTYKIEQFYSSFIIYLNSFDNSLFLGFFYYTSLLSYLQGDPNGNKHRFGSFLGHPCHFRSRGIKISLISAGRSVYSGGKILQFAIC